MEIYSVCLTDKLPEALFNKLLSYLPPDEQEKATKFLRWQDSQLSLLACLLKRYILSIKTGIPYQNLQFSRNRFGKPFLINFDNIQFNLSHSGSYVVMAVSNHIIGIDIEKIKKVDLSIAKRFFSEEESKYLFTMNQNKRLDYFFDLWTLKESYIKADGRGLSVPLDSFSIIKNEDNKIIIKTNNQLKNCYFYQYKINDDYKLSVCSSQKNFPSNITNMVLNLSSDSFYSVFKII